MFKFRSLYLFIMLLSYPLQSHADTVKADTVGGVLGNITGELKSTGGLFRIVCYLAGLTFTMMGLFKLKEYMDNPGKVGMKEPVSKLLVGGFFIVLPTFIYMFITSTVGSNGDLSLNMTGYFK